MIVAGFELIEDDPVALLPQGLARLGAGIIELARLADDDGTGADDQDGMDVGALGHGLGLERGRAPAPDSRAGGHEWRRPTVPRAFPTRPWLPLPGRTGIRRRPAGGGGSDGAHRRPSLSRDFGQLRTGNFRRPARGRPGRFAPSLLATLPRRPRLRRRSSRPFPHRPRFPSTPEAGGTPARRHPRAWGQSIVMHATILLTDPMLGPGTLRDRPAAIPAASRVHEGPEDPRGGGGHRRTGS
jgi:hypothetical protein